MFQTHTAPATTNNRPRLENGHIRIGLYFIYLQKLYIATWENDNPMFTAHRSIGKSSENFFFGFSMLAVNKQRIIPVSVFHVPGVGGWAQTRSKQSKAECYKCL